ncbi:hypothetical protein ELQ21_03945 [Neisseria meningitidis]|nr:hypothetical protein [Neisseria meningitidis]MBG8597746.1 hypothetical protein [Neisseria meningitidis]MBG8648974.1 hypothetical protein [Neisseria meningitidis]MBG8653351.1 hypothetical protein [Neisseria meningitidis]MBG8668997.1 hypothetical protein [Neisseria meningitidis]
MAFCFFESLAMSRNLLVRWLVVCLIPLATLAVFAANPPEDKPQHLINGIILACEATFLFKFVLFDTIKHHLKQEFDLKRQTMLLFIPIVLLVVYLFHYFGAF